MLLCLYRHPGLPDAARLGLVASDSIVDVHLACLTSLAGHMKPRRAHEIADALAPAELLRFVEGGRHSWNALRDSLDRLGASLGPDLLSPDGLAVMVEKIHVRFVPLLPAAAGWSSEPVGRWEPVPVPSPGSSTSVLLHTDGRAYLPEYLAVIGATVAEVAEEDAMEAVALIAAVRPSRPQSSALLHRPPELPADEPELEATVATAVAAASRQHALFAGDVVRCGPAVVDRPVDIRDRDVAPMPARRGAEIVPAR